MKNRKCTRCDGPVTADELLIVKGLLANEIREDIMVLKDPEVDFAEAVDTVLDPLLEHTPVCLNCFQDVQSRTPIRAFLGGGMAALVPSFVWKEMKLDVLEA